MATTDSAPPLDAHDAPAVPRMPPVAFVAAWMLFWVLMLTIAVQDFLRQGQQGLWKPVLWEGSSFVVASALAALGWRRVHRCDALLGRPWRWFAAQVAWLPLFAPVFVAGVFGLRHAVYGALGFAYVHEPWPVVLRYESLKFSLFYLLFVAVVFGVRAHASIGAARVRTERAQAALKQAQLTQLAQQLEPHFLFNALNTIAATVHADPAQADALLMRLAALLRAATDLARRPDVEMAEELRLLEAYAAIMRERFADRVAVHFEVDAQAARCRVPALIAQPLLENAFRHGVEPHASFTTIRVRVHVANARLHIEVHDDGASAAAPLVPGVGLANVQQRLALCYGADASLALEPRTGGGATARIVLPCAC